MILENFEIRNLINRFEESSQYISNLSKNLKSFNGILVNLENQIAPLDNLRKFLSESNIISNLDSISTNSLEISEKVNSNISSIDNYVSSVDRLTINYSKNVDKTLESLKNVRDLIETYNSEVAPLSSKIKEEFRKLNSIDIKDIGLSLSDKLGNIQAQLTDINQFFNQEFQNLYAKNDKCQKLFLVNSKEYKNKISESYEEVFQEQKDYSKKISELIDIHKSIKKSISSIESQNKEPLGYFSELCNLWAAENIRRSSLKKNRSIPSIFFCLLIILLFSCSLFLNYDQFFNNSKWSEKLNYNVKSIFINNDKVFDVE